MPSASAWTSASATERAFSVLVRLAVSAATTKWRAASRVRTWAGMRAELLPPSSPSGAAIELRQHEFAVTERLGGGEAAIGGAADHVDERVTGLVERHLAAEYARHVHVDMLRHGAH